MQLSRFKICGWGHADEIVSADEAHAVTNRIGSLFGGVPDNAIAAPTEEEISVPRSRINVKPSLSEICSDGKYDRLVHTYGQSIFDLTRSFERDFQNIPDVVARPRNRTDVVEILEWASSNNLAVIPYGGGTTVAGGTEAQFCEDYDGVISLNTQALAGVFEIDSVARVARIGSGTFGPAIEDGLKAQGLTLRHFPQSFAYSTLGGWIACRAAGHFATLYTHADDLVESLQLVTPEGTVETRRLPSTGNGPNEERFFSGTEGILGVFTEAWMKLRPLPRYRAAAAVSFDDFLVGAKAVKAIVQAGLNPANCRLISAKEIAAFSPGGSPGHKLMLGFENGDVPVDALMSIALDLARGAGGKLDGNDAGDSNGNRQGVAGSYRDGFMRMPYWRETMTAHGFVFDTIATSITWERFDNFYAELNSVIENAILRVTGQQGLVTTRFSHVYPDGPAPYFTYFAKGKQGSLSRQSSEIRTAALDAIHRLGGPVTHHQAVGRQHRPWYDKQRSHLFAKGLMAMKKEFDPKGIMNPGVLIDPQPAR